MECLKKYIVSHNRKYYLLTLIPYVPYNVPTIDSYYIISNKEYHSGGIRVDFNLKQALYDLGVCDVGKNTLCYDADLGSRFYIRAEEIPKCKPTEKQKQKKLCSGCLRCQKACPTNAIDSDGFHRERCLRQQMEDGKYIDEQKAGTRVLGCDVCQRVCPLNKKEFQPLPEELSLSGLKQSAEGDMQSLKALIGSNYARRKKLTYLIDVAIKNSKKETEC